METLFAPCTLSHFCFLPCTAFFQPSDAPLSTFSLFSGPLKLYSPWLPSLSIVHRFTPHLFFVHIPVHAWRSVDRATQDVVSSLYAQFTLNVPNEQFPTLLFPATLPLPLNAFGITILSESFIYPLFFVHSFIHYLSLFSLQWLTPHQIHTSFCSLFACAASTIICHFVSFVIPNLLMASLDHNQQHCIQGHSWKIWTYQF